MRHSENCFGTSSGHQEDDAHSWKGLPVIFDEVFTGLYRLGRFSAASFLGVDPDISVHAKLLTGGLFPLAVTLTSESVFPTFDHEKETSNTLLHGRSYTAHPVGCHVALESIRAMQKMERRGEWDWARRENGWSVTADEDNKENPVEPIVWSVWDADFVVWLSRQRNKPGLLVRSTWALGSVLAMRLDVDSSVTAATNDVGAAETLEAVLRQDFVGAGGGSPWNVHTRAMGDTLYLMASQTTSKEDIALMEERLRYVLAY